MPRPLGDAAGERLALPAYYADFEQNFAHAREFWKLERGQVFAEPGNASWEAFASGDWEESLRRIEDLREDLRKYHQETAAAGTSTHRIRIVSLPPTAYIQWELYVLRLRDETGGPIRILQAADVADLEDEGPLPDIYTMDRDIMYQAVYDEHGVLEHALKYTDQELVSRCRDFIARLYARGEPISSFFEREIAHLPPPRPTQPAIPADYLEQTGRPGPIRS
jgi:hypothetical protein